MLTAWRDTEKTDPEAKEKEEKIKINNRNQFLKETARLHDGHWLQESTSLTALISPVSPHPSVSLRHLSTASEANVNTLTAESAITPTPSSTPTTVSYNSYEKTPTSKVYKMWSTASYFTMLATVATISGKHEMARAIGYDQD